MSLMNSWRRTICFAIAQFVLACSVPVVQAAEWPQWRGPDGQGISNAKNLPVRWSEKENVTWRTELPGKGWSSPVIEGQQIWLTSAIETPLTDEEKKERLKGKAGANSLSVSGKLSMRAQCVDRTSGKLLHDLELMVEDSPDPIHALNSFASPSPIIEKGRLYCCFGTNGTACVDTNTARVVWTNRETRIKHENGPGSTPILWNDLLIFHCDGSDVQYIVALDKHTGKIAWKTERSGQMKPDPQLKKAYGTPIVLNIAGKEQLVSQGADWLYSYEPATGKELWKMSYGTLGFSIVPRPVYGDGLLFISTTFMQAEILAVKITAADAPPEIVWRMKKTAPQMPSPLLVGKELFVVTDKGIATCVDAATGTQHWTERISGNYSSSPYFADGRIYVGNRDGLTYVYEATKTFTLLAQNQLEGQIMATPAIVDNALFIRTDKALYRIEKRDNAKVSLK